MRSENSKSVQISSNYFKIFLENEMSMGVKKRIYNHYTFLCLHSSKSQIF